MAFQDMRSAPGVEEERDIFGTQKQWMGVRHPVAPQQIEARLVRVSDTHPVTPSRIDASRRKGVRHQRETAGPTRITARPSTCPVKAGSDIP